MKRTFYLTYHSGDTLESIFNNSLWVLDSDKPDLPYIEIEATVKHIEPKYISHRSSFAEKIGASIIIPKDF